jgi:uncharacterized membrane protein
VARITGVQNDSDDYRLLRSFGLREIAAGVGILTRPRTKDWMWARVAGDVMDLAYLGSSLRSGGSQRMRIATATAAVLGVTALDYMCSQELNRMEGSPDRTRGRHVKKSTTVNCTPDKAYEFWRDFDNLPSFMSNLESVESFGDGRSHWKVKGPGNSSVEWDSEIINDVPNRLLAWRAMEGADVYNAGSVRFEPAPGGRGTEVSVRLYYEPPAGSLGVAIATMFGKEPRQDLDRDLRVFKQLIETGEVMKSDASIHWGMHPARPEGNSKLEERTEYAGQLLDR